MEEKDYVTGTGFDFELDVSMNETPSYEKLCIVSFTDETGETIETWTDLCNKFANNERVSLDPTFSIVAKLDKASPVIQMILSKRYATGKNAKIKTKFTDYQIGEKGTMFEFLALLSNPTRELVGDAITELSFDLKVANGGITETPVA